MNWCIRQKDRERDRQRQIERLPMGKAYMSPMLTDGRWCWRTGDGGGDGVGTMKLHTHR